MPFAGLEASAAGDFYTPTESGQAPDIEVAEGTEKKG